MPLTLPPAQKAVPAPVISSAPTSGLSPQLLIMLRSAGVKSSESALRTSGRLSVITATRSRIAHSNSLVPVSTVISVVILDSPYLFPPSFRGDAEHRNRNLEIPGLVLAHHPGMTFL